MIDLRKADCTEEFFKVINDGKYDSSKIVIVTDPPFNIGYKYATYKDRMNEKEYYNMLCGIFGNRQSVIVHYPECLHKLSIHLATAPEKVISWVYNSNTGKQHRDIGFYNIKPNMSQVRQPYKNLNDKRIQERIARGCEGAKLYDWWNINQVKNVSKEKTEHPCQMPLEVMKNIIGLLPYDAIIVDPFMGSGTTGVAVIEMNKKQNANRKFIGIELDEKYFKTAKKRTEEAQKNNIDVIEEQTNIYDFI